MERSKMGDVILALRKKRGLTQEQLAAKVGVSAGAVSKWETGGSSPDIFLLSPLARALDTTPDELLSFRRELPEEELARIKEELRNLYLFDSYAAGEASAERYMKEYPNSGRLKLVAAGLGQMFLGLREGLPEEEIEAKLRRCLSLLQEAAESCGDERREEALFVSAGIHMRLNEPEVAEALLRDLPAGRGADPMNLYPAVLLKLGRYPRMVELCQQQLLQHVTLSGVMLSYLAQAADGEGREADKRLYLTAAHQLERLFGLHMGAGARGLALQSLRSGHTDEAARWFGEYAEMVLGMEPDYRSSPYFGNIKLEVDPSGQLEIGKRLLASLLEEKEWEPLSGLPVYEAALSRIRARLGEM
ncbi:helix-turn-helix domain-containing protein [Paenibacillus sp. YN15]|uniref:helix-turn-helix domain-containing protein n=1 Tax=Paenibacillus sp. YN15 TaxID=1742774 RepID=UPI000DCCFCCC|nr:helix-turn-helix transcriptional regulator [Paenibacillus sp. YN15]RAU97889.1 XRE family transcriptional regulator [Paenibacillus sp. YN15]